MLLRRGDFFPTMFRSRGLTAHGEMWSDKGTIHLLDDYRFNHSTMCGCHEMSKSKGWFSEEDMSAETLEKLDEDSTKWWADVKVCKKCLAAARKRGLLD